MSFFNLLRDSAKYVYQLLLYSVAQHFARKVLWVSYDSQNKLLH
jgi:hypothetical protein